MVEHNLAKVGVASSNLVSRSILLLIFLSLSLFANPYSLCEQKLALAYEQVYPNIIINHLQVSSSQALPKDFNSYKLKDISISKALLKREKGSFTAQFITTQNKIKKLRFNFTATCFIDVLVASKDIQRNQKLSSQNTQTQQISLQKAPRDLLSFNPNLVSKFHIKKGSMLSSYQFKQEKLIKRGENIRAIIKEGALSLEFDAIALQAGDKDELIRIQSKDRKIFTGTIIGAKKVFIK